MEQSATCNAVNVLYYLYFEKKELVHYFERVWTKDGMRFSDEEYAYIFCGRFVPDFPVDLETYYFLLDKNIIEETGGNEHERTFALADYYRTYLARILRRGS